MEPVFEVPGSGAEPRDVRIRHVLASRIDVKIFGFCGPSRRKSVFDTGTGRPSDRYGARGARQAPVVWAPGEVGGNHLRFRVAIRKSSRAIKEQIVR